MTADVPGYSTSPGRFEALCAAAAARDAENAVGDLEARALQQVAALVKPIAADLERQRNVLSLVALVKPVEGEAALDALGAFAASVLGIYADLQADINELHPNGPVPS